MRCAAVSFISVFWFLVLYDRCVSCVSNFGALGCSAAFAFFLRYVVVSSLFFFQTRSKNMVGWSEDARMLERSCLILVLFFCFSFAMFKF